MKSTVSEQKLEKAYCGTLPITLSVLFGVIGAAVYAGFVFC